MASSNITPSSSTATRNSVLAEIRNKVVFRTSQPPPTDTTNVTLTDYQEIINGSAKELYDELITAYEDYNSVGYLGNPNDPIAQGNNLIVTNGGDSAYGLPDDLYKITRVDLITNMAGTGQSILQGAITIKGFMNNERNDGWPYAGTAWVAPYTNCRFRQIGQEWIEFAPRPPPANMPFLVTYVPLMPYLYDTGIITLYPDMAPGDQITIQGTIRVVYQATYASGQPFPQFQVVPGNPEQSCINLAAAINAIPPWGFTNAGANSQTRTYGTATAIGNTVQLVLTSPQQITWFPSSDFVSLSPYQGSSELFGTPNNYTWQNYYGINWNGYDEYIVLDAAMKIATRQRSNALYADLAGAKAMLKQRIATVRANRNAGTSFRITDARRRRAGYGMYGGGGLGF